MARPSALGLLAAALATATDVLYVVVIASQGPPYEAGTVALVASAIALAAGVAVYGSLGPTGSGRRRLLYVPAGALLVLGVLGMFSIGLPLFVAGVLALAAAIRSRQPIVTG